MENGGTVLCAFGSFDEAHEEASSLAKFYKTPFRVVRGQNSSWQVVIPDSTATGLRERLLRSHQRLAPHKMAGPETRSSGGPPLGDGEDWVEDDYLGEDTADEVEIEACPSCGCDSCKCEDYDPELAEKMQDPDFDPWDPDQQR